LVVKTKSNSITYDEFTRVLADVLLVHQEKLTPETSFTNDLFIDSLKMVEMALRIEQLGVSIPTEAYWEIQTVGDAYEAYSNHNSKP
jgi:acyl carrier protein